MRSGNPAPRNEFIPLDSTGPDPDGKRTDAIHPATCGNKAARLSLLRRAGLPVLPGVVWGGPETPDESVFIQLNQSLPWPWILRSSGLSEDGDASSFAGCYRSLGPVSGAKAAKAAFLKVRETTAAATLLGTLSRTTAGPPAVLIQPYLAFAFSGVALWTRPDDESTLRIEGSSSGSVVEGDASETLPGTLQECVRQLARATAAKGGPEGLDLEWGAVPRIGDQTVGDWEVVLLQARPLLPSAQDPPPYMSAGVWTLNRQHQPLVLSPFYASVIELSRTRLGVAQGAWLGRLYEGSVGSMPVTDPGGSKICDGPLFSQRQRLSLQLARFLRFVRSYLTLNRPVRPGASCVAALLAAAPADIGPARERWYRFCGFFPAWWDPQAPSIGDGLERLRAICQVKPDEAGPKPDPGTEPSTPWRIFERCVDSREQDDWVFARMLRVLRDACLDWGAAAAAAGWVGTPEDVFLLTVSELLCGIRPPAELIGRRRDLQTAQASFLVPERVADGVPQWSEPPEASWSGELLGQAAVPGRAEGIAGPLPGPGETADGRIAVVHALTPQDIVFLPGVAGLVIERPGTCGHAVLIARELGIPAVTQARQAIGRIPAGARVQLDGTTGRVRWHQNY